MDRQSPSLAPPHDEGADPSKLKLVLVSVLPGLGLALFSVLAYQLFSVAPSRQRLMTPIQPVVIAPQKHTSPETKLEKSERARSTTVKEVVQSPAND